MESMGMIDKFYQISYGLMKLLLVNMLWLLFNFPIVYIVLVTLTVKSMNELYLLIMIIMLLLPFIFFPATTAMFAVIRRGTLYKKDDRLLSYFWKAYKQNYRRSLVGGIMITVIWIVWIYNYHLSGIEIGSALSYIYLAFTVFLLAFTNYFFADSVHYHLPFIVSIKKSIMMSIGFPHYTISIIGVSGVCLYSLYVLHPIFLVLYGGILPAIICFLGYYFIYLRAKKSKEMTEDKKQWNPLKA
ncbi:Uncharacterized membrane protein YesL [Gracilibacillus orientalis]|uniref:Uncharacterized membrane protein YesL n=1 Tax=Gracilibacillus orientalis TaxID=334253 RepID=A0A1I4HKM6_9BACI|nr:DUF624 domain-containing protein [Gracilibacillus orientalis]SFL42253.1 Uncharacterized membrane protein YesL [Gracilibacillus orientalis]